MGDLYVNWRVQLSCTIVQTVLIALNYLQDNIYINTKVKCYNTEFIPKVQIVLKLITELNTRSNY